MEVNKNWGKPKKIILTKEMSSLLLNACNEHLKRTNADFHHELNSTKNKTENFDIIGEFANINGELCITARAKKIIYQKNSKVVPSGVSQKTLLDSSIT